MKMYIGVLLIGALMSMISAWGTWLFYNDPQWNHTLTEKIIATVSSFIGAFIFAFLLITGSFLLWWAER